MARSVEALFSHPAAVSRSEEMVWEDVEEPPGPDPASADPEALHGAVADFLASPPLERDGKARALRLEAAALREADAVDVLADAVERLTSHLGDPPDEASVAMARALLTEGVGACIAARLGAARNDERRGELTRTCRILGQPMIEALADALSATQDRFARRAYVDTIVAFGQDAMPVIERMAEDRRWFVVRNAAAILGDVGGERAVELVTATLAHPRARVRREGLLALAKIGGQDAEMLVYGMIDDPDPDVRLAAAMAAGELKIERALRPLLAVLDDDSDPDLVVGILHALGQLGDPGAVVAVEKRAVGSFLSRPPAAVRIAAYRALFRIGTPHAKGVLVRAADDGDAEVKAAVRALLGMR
jgi:hypothetical protein